MRSSLVPPSLLAVLLLVAGAASAEAASPATVEQTLVAFSTALAKGDATALRSLTAPGFVLLDEGRVYDVPAMIASVQATLALGTMVREPKDFGVTVRGNVAWAHYRVTGRFSTAQDEVLLALLESAVLERADGRWRLVQVATLPEASR